MTDKNNGHFGSLVTGLFLGAVAVVLAHKPTRMRIMKAFENVVEDGEDAFSELEGKVSDISKNAKKRVARNLKTAQEKLEASR